MTYKDIFFYMDNMMSTILRFVGIFVKSLDISLVSPGIDDKCVGISQKSLGI